jgi:hypothetical protein
LFANIYLNELDQFVKQNLKVTRYARYTDDFIIVSADHTYLADLVPQIEAFLRERLRLSLHPRKVEIRPYARGIDFLGYVILPHHTMLRTTTKRRMLRKLRERVAAYRSGQIEGDQLLGSLWSYLGVLSHADAHRMTERLKNVFWFWLHE